MCTPHPPPYLHVHPRQYRSHFTPTLSFCLGLRFRLSFSLGIINLLPVPVLDGGQIIFYSLEAIRGRPLPLILRERIQMVGVLFMMGLMLLVTVLDVSRLFDG